MARKPTRKAMRIKAEDPEAVYPVVPRDEKGRILPGHTLNPGGRSKAVDDARRKALGYALRCIEILWNIARSAKQPASSRIRACEVILERGLGKPVQAVEISSTEGAPIPLAFVPGRARFLAEATGPGDGDALALADDHGPDGGVPA